MPPRRQTADELKLKGSWRAKGREATEIPRQDGLPEMPADLSNDAADRWRELVPMLAAMGTLQPADGPALGRLCELYADETKIRREIADVATDDPLRADSLRRILSKLVDQCRSLEIEFAMTPASRSKVSVATRPVIDEVAEFEAFLKADRA